MGVQVSQHRRQPARSWVAPAALVMNALATGLAAAQGPIVAWGYPYPLAPTNVPPGQFAVVAVPRHEHGLAIRPDGTLVGWGSNTHGQINVPTGQFIAAAAGELHSAAVRADGTLVAWGFPWGVVPAGECTSVVTGLNFSIGLRTNGELAGWGSNDYPGAPAYPGPISGIPAGPFRDVAAGYWHALAIREDGTLATWGWPGPSSPTHAAPPGRFIDVAAGAEFSVALREDGTLVAWGEYAYALKAPAGTFVAVSASAQNGAALRADGTVVTWGFDSGPGGVMAPPPGRFSSVVVGPTCALAIKSGTCFPDCNGDGILNLADFGCFQTKFALADPYADCDGDGSLNLADFGCFQTQFALGCP